MKTKYMQGKWWYLGQRQGESAWIPVSEGRPKKRVKRNSGRLIKFRFI